MNISIIIPTYNAANHLHVLLKNIADQSISDFELIIIDSSSSDETPKIA